MSRGYFAIDENPDIKWDIKCELHPEYSKEDVPIEQANLYTEIETVNTIIIELKYTPDTRKNEYFKKLLSLAQAGLTGETAQPKLAIISLNKLKEEILKREGSRIKNEYMKKLGFFAFIFATVSLIMGIIIKVNWSTDYCIYFFVWVGAMPGSWISFGVRKTNFLIEDLNEIEKDGLSPIIRLIFVGISSIFLVLFLKSNIITMKVGGFDIDSINNNTEFQILLGGIAGLIEHKLPIDLYNRATNILKI